VEPSSGEGCAGFAWVGSRLQLRRGETGGRGVESKRLSYCIGEFKMRRSTRGIEQSAIPNMTDRLAALSASKSAHVDQGPNPCRHRAANPEITEG
jgi:hypothetical protein